MISPGQTSPDYVRELWRSSEIVEVTHGRSGDLIYIARRNGHFSSVIKFATQANCARLLNEAARTRWAFQKGLPVPEVLYSDIDVHGAWLVTREISGTILSASSLLADQACELVSQALLSLHQEYPDCPFDEGSQTRLRRAGEKILNGEVDPSSFDADLSNLSPAEILKNAHNIQPALHQPVLTHGDPTLENILVQDGAFLGLVDCGGLGIADPYRDLAIATRSFAKHYSRTVSMQFLKGHLGSDPDLKRLEFFRLLSEFD